MYSRTQLTQYNYCTTCAVTNGSFKIDALQKNNINLLQERCLIQNSIHTEKKIKNYVMKFVSYEAF